MIYIKNIIKFINAIYPELTIIIYIIIGLFSRSSDLWVYALLSYSTLAFFQIIIFSLLASKDAKIFRSNLTLGNLTFLVLGITFTFLIFTFFAIPILLTMTDTLNPTLKIGPLFFVAILNMSLVTTQWLQISPYVYTRQYLQQKLIFTGRMIYLALLLVVYMVLANFLLLPLFPFVILVLLGIFTMSILLYSLKRFPVNIEKL